MIPESAVHPHLHAVSIEFKRGTLNQLPQECPFPMSRPLNQFNAQYVWIHPQVMRVMDLDDELRPGDLFLCTKTEIAPDMPLQMNTIAQGRKKCENENHITDMRGMMILLNSVVLDCVLKEQKDLLVAPRDKKDLPVVLRDQKDRLVEQKDQRDQRELRDMKGPIDMTDLQGMNVRMIAARRSLALMRSLPQDLALPLPLLVLELWQIP